MPLKLHTYRGCHNCPLSTNEGLPCYTVGQPWIEVEITFSSPQYIFASDRNIKTFSKGDVVSAKAIIKHGVIYCIKAYSTIIPAYEYSIDLSGIKVKVPSTGQRTQIVKFNNTNRSQWR